MSSILRFAVVIAAFLALDVAEAQQTLPAVRVQPTTARKHAQADSIEARAVRLSGTPRGWPDAARLFRSSAELRGVDTGAVRSWRMAAWAYSSVNDLGKAREMMERAAECAAAVGDVEGAANAYVDAALIAIEDHRGDRSELLVGKARTIVASPLLAAERRAVLLQRIGDEPRVAAARVASRDSSRP